MQQSIAKAKGARIVSIVAAVFVALACGTNVSGLISFGDASN